MNPSIEDGLIAAAEVTGDLSDVKLWAQLYADVASGIDAEVVATDTCSLAFGSMVIRPDVRAPCFVVVLEDWMIVAWRKGMFRKSVVSEVVRFAEVTDVTWGPGTTSSTRNAQLARIVLRHGEVVLALPLTGAGVAGAALKSAILK